jgi:hypothetical protein
MLQEEIKRDGVRPFCRKAKDKRMWAGKCPVTQ